MTPRKAIALLALLVGLWLLWEGLQAVILITSRGSPLGDALLNPPTSIIRIVGAGVLVIGAALVILARKWGQWLVLLGTLIIALLAILMAASGADQSMWQGEALFAVCLGVLSGLMITRLKA